MKFLSGLGLGVLLGIGMIGLLTTVFNRGSTAAEVEPGPDFVRGQVLSSGGAVIDFIDEHPERGPVIQQDASSPAREAADRPTRDRSIPGLRGSVVRRAERLPSAKRCLVDRSFNPGAIRIEDRATLRELETLIDEQNRRVFKFQEEMDSVARVILDAKMKAGVDPPETWKLVPEGDILLSIERTLVSRTSGSHTTGTVLRKGESPEYEALDAQLTQAMVDARVIVRTWIQDYQR